MRIQDLNEANLSAAEMPPKKLSGVENPKTKKPYTRAELFLVKVMTKSPFERVGGGEVIIDPAEAKRVKDWIARGPAGVIALKTLDGNTVKNTELQKTIEFGSKGSELIAVKPSDVFPAQDVDVEQVGNNIEAMMSAGAFYAKDFYNKIADNPQLKKSGKVGQAIIDMAGQIANGQKAQVPDGLSADEVKAIELYASEFLGVMSVIYGTANFDRRDKFLGWVGQDLGDLLMFFPKASNNPIADSYGLLNRETGNALAISSKAAGKGAPPALTSLKMPDFIKKKYPEAYEFIRVAQTQGTGITQPFYMMNKLHEMDPNLIPDAYRGLVPWNEEVMSQIAQSFKGKPAKIPMKVLQAAAKRLSEKVAQGTATDGGKVFWAVISDVMKLVNGGAVPNFREAILTSLGFNFVQIYSNIKNGVLETKAFWPAQINGRVMLKTKSSASEDKGKIGYQVSD